MSENLKRTIQALEIISQVKQPKLRNAVLKDLSSNKILYKALREIALNIARSNIPLSAGDKKKLKKFYVVISHLSAKKVAKRKRRTLVEQSGGFLPVIIPIVTSILAELLNGSQ